PGQPARPRRRPPSNRHPAPHRPRRPPPPLQGIRSACRTGMGTGGAKLKYAHPGRDSCQNPPTGRRLSWPSDAPMISLTQTAILLAAAVIAVSLFRLLRLSSILGYVAA